MFSIPTSWEFASLICKFLLYFGTATIAGGSLCLWRFSDGRQKAIHFNLSYIILGALLGFQASLLNFLIQIGLINDDGFSGMFDWSMGSLLLDTQLGDVTIVRLACFTLVLISNVLFQRKVNSLTRPPDRRFYATVMAVNGATMLLLLFTFRQAGHVSVLSLTAQIAIGLHVLCMAIWVGSLCPLLVMTGILASSGDSGSLQSMMKHFGDLAIGVVLVLLLSGVLMLLQLFGSFGEVFSSAYGLSMLAKLTLVLGLLAIAGLNKFVLVPKLIDGDGGFNREGVGSLKQSIRSEIVVASLILLLTTYLSTIVGPAGH